MRKILEYGFIAFVSCFLLSCGVEEEKIYKYEFRTGTEFSMKFFTDSYTEDSTFYYINRMDRIERVYKDKVLYIVENKNCN